MKNIELTTVGFGCRFATQIDFTYGVLGFTPAARLFTLLS